MEMREQFWSEEFEGYGEKYFEIPSFRDIKETIERQYMRELKSAPFSRKDTELVPDAGACINCPKMTGNNRAEYPDGRADMCADVPCFERKLKAHCARQVEKAKDSGAQVLDEAESAKMFQVAGGKAWLSYNAGQKYFPLEDQCWQDKEHRSYKQLIDGHLQPVVAVDPFGHPHFLAPKAETEKVLKEVHKIKSETSRAMSDHRASDRKRQEEKKIRQATAAEIVTRAITDWPFPVLADPAFLRVMATHLIDNGGADAARAIAKRRQIEYDPNHVRGSVEKIVAGLAAEDLPALIVECLIQQELDFWAQWGGDRGDKFRLCDYFDMKPNVVKKQVEAKLKQEAKAKKAKPKPKAKPKAKAAATV
jgi:ParB family transcriptional regulator, chromosome partitioning protein